MSNESPLKDFLDGVIEWISMILPVLLVILGLVYLNRWSNEKARVNEQERKVRQEQLMNSPKSSPTYSTPSSSSSDYVSEHGTDECTSDCSGHDAGYEYAEDNEICDTDYEGSHSDSFNEGVVAWAEDNC